MMNEPEPFPVKPEANQPAEPHQLDFVKRSKLPDFQPLGNIRDYFTEQMKQDPFDNPLYCHPNQTGVQLTL